MAIIEDRRPIRRQNRTRRRYLPAATAKIGEKIREEAAEVVEAADEPGVEGREHLIHEAADLIYHLFVMLGYRDIKLTEVEEELVPPLRHLRPRRKGRPQDDVGTARMMM